MKRFNQFLIFGALAGLLGLAASVRANVSGFSLSCSPCSAPAGGTFVLTVNWCESTQYNSPLLLVAFRPAGNTTITSCPVVNQDFVIYSGSAGNSTTTGPGAGYTLPANAGVAGACHSMTFTVTVPGTLSGNYNIIGVAAQDYVSCSTGNQQVSGYTAFTTSAPTTCNATLLKRVEGTAQSNQLMLYWVDYDYFNDTGLSIQDTIPCGTIVNASPEPIDGSAYDSCGAGCVHWDIPNADPASPTPYRRKGSLWILVDLGACSGAICNTATSTGVCTGSVDSNDVCQTVGTVNVQLIKSQNDMTGNPVTSVANGTQIQYVLQYQFSGSGLKCFDSFQSYTVGTNYQGAGNTLAVNNPTGGSWYYGPGDPGNIAWRIINGDTPGEKNIQFQGTAGNYRGLLYDCPLAKQNGEDFCGGMVEADVRIDGNIVNGDTGIMIRQDNQNPGNSYMALLTVDPYPGNPGTGAGHFQIQKNRLNAPCWEGECPAGTASATCPANMGVVMPAALSPQFGIWYTIKVLEQPIGTFSAKYWKRGTPEPPGWLLNWTDTGACNGPMLDCTDPAPTDGIIWRPGIAGQADLMSYDNFRVYSANSLTNAKLWDTIPVGIDYQSANPVPNGSTPAGTGANEGMIRWDFTTGNYGAVAGNLLYEGTGSFTWVGVADCTESLTALNQASLGSTAPLIWNDSNQTSLSITGCGTPSFTPTRTNTPTVTPSPTPTYTRTVTPSPTPTFTPTSTRTATPTSTITVVSPTFTSTATRTATPSNTETNTPGPTATYTATRTATPTHTPSPTSTFTFTQTVTRTATPSVTDTNTLGPTPTYTVTRSNTATSTATPTHTPTFTATPTYTQTVTVTATPTNTPTRTETATITETMQYSATNTPTITVTFTMTATRTATITASATPTATPTYTQTVTFTSTYTATPTRTETATATVTQSYTSTPTRSATPTITLTWTASQTPIPVPHHVRIMAYNSAGELVKLLFDGAAQFQPGQLQFDKDLIPGGAGSLAIDFPGYLWDSNLNQQVSGVAWAADNDNGQVVNGGIYTIKAEIVDQFGQVTTLQRSIQVISVVPQNSLDIFNSAGELVASLPLPALGTGRFQSLAMDESNYAPQYDSVSGAVVGGSLTLKLKDEQGADYSVSWDGRNSLGVPVASGNYIAELVYFAPGGGGRRVVESKSIVVLQGSASADFAGAYAYPNPAQRGGDLKISYPVSARYGASAKLYNLAGELISQAEDHAKSGIFTFSSADLASGVYAVELDKLSGGTLVARTILKVAIVH
jgi:hypothetical protein